MASLGKIDATGTKSTAGFRTAAGRNGHARGPESGKLEGVSGEQSFEELPRIRSDVREEAVMRPTTRCFIPATLVALVAIVLLPAAVSAECPPDGLGVPCTANSTIPCGIELVGAAGGVADPLGQFVVVVRDVANNPVAGADVSLDFGSCFDTRIATAQPYQGITVACNGGAAVVHATTDANGQARFRIAGGGTLTAGGAPGAGYGCAVVRAGTETLGAVNVAALDLNGASGLNPVDLALFLSDSFASASGYVGRLDYNCSHSVNPADFAMLISASLGGGSSSSAAGYCQ